MGVSMEVQPKAHASQRGNLLKKLRGLQFKRFFTVHYFDIKLKSHE